MLYHNVEAYEKLSAQKDIMIKLIEAEAQAAQTDVRYDHETVFGELRAEISKLVKDNADA